MLTAYLRAAMRQAHYEILADDGTFYGEIRGVQGVWANASKLEECRDELESALEEWVLLGLQMGHELPVVDGLDLNLKETVENGRIYLPNAATMV